MSMFPRPVSELYVPKAPHVVEDIEPDARRQAWGYTVGVVTDKAGNNVPPHGSTTVFLINPGGMTEPMLDSRPKHTATSEINVLRGSGMLIRALASGGTEVVPLKKSTEVIIRPGQAYTYVNTGKGNLLLHEEASPALGPDDEIALVQPYAKSARAEPMATSSIVNRDKEGAITGVIEIARSLAPPKRFYDLIDEVAGGMAGAWI